MRERTGSRDLDLRRVLILLVFSALLSVNFVEAWPIDDGPGLQTRALELSKQWSRASLVQSSELFEAAAQYWVGVAEPGKAADCLREAGRIQVILSNNTRAKLFLHMALLIERDAHDTVRRSVTLAEIGRILLIEGDVNGSNENINSSIDLAFASDDADARSRALLVKANFLNNGSDDALTIRTFLESLQYAIKTGNTDLVGQVSLDLSYAYVKAGNYDLAIATSKKSLEAYRHAGDKRGEALAMMALGFSFRSAGEEQQAMTAYAEAAESFPPDVDQLEHARLLAAEGAIFADFGEGRLMETKVRAAYEFYKDARYLRGQLAILPTLLESSLADGDFRQADRFQREIISLAKTLNDDFIVGYTDSILGNDELKRGSSKKSIRRFRSAIMVFEKYKNLAEVTKARIGLGEAFEQYGLYNDARRNYEIALTISEQIKDKLAESDSLFHLAGLANKRKDQETALNYSTRSIDITDSLFSDVSNSRLRTAHFSTLYQRYLLHTTLLFNEEKKSSTGEFAIRALQTSERSRSRSLLESLRLSGADFKQDANSEEIANENELLVQLDIKTNRLSELLGNDAEETKIKALENEILGLQVKLAALKAEIKQKSPVYSSIKDPPPFDVAAFQSAVLDDNSVLLEFSLGNEESYLWVLGKTEITSYILPPRAQIESRIEKIRSLLSQNSQLPNESIDSYQQRVADIGLEYSQEARALSRDLLGQAADELVGKRLIVVPDGKIHYLPLGALPFPNSLSDDPILLTNEVVYEPSAAALMLIEKTVAVARSPKNDLLLVSDPVFSKTDERVGSNGVSGTGVFATLLGRFRSFESLDSLPRLPASRDEANSIAGIVGASATTARSGFDANRENILNSGLADYKVIHFATHGLLDETRPELSGIVLSLFDEAGRQQNGGFLRLQDVYSMNLKADLVVLSACDTGLGKEIKGEGLMSLNNAFLQAGAKTVVSSLWKIEDTSAKQLMADLYGGMAEQGLSSSEALRQAQIKLRNDPRFSSPFYWASFTAEGDFKTVPHFSGERTSLIYDSAIILISLTGMFMLRKVQFRKSGAAANASSKASTQR